MSELSEAMEYLGRELGVQYVDPYAPTALRKIRMLLEFLGPQHTADDACCAVALIHRILNGSDRTEDYKQFAEWQGVFEPPDWATDAWLRTLSVEGKMAARQRGESGAVPKSWSSVDAILFWWESEGRTRWLAERGAAPHQTREET